MRTPAIRQIVIALARGDTLMVPCARMLDSGTTVERLASLALHIGAGVIVCDELPEVTTREQVYA